MRNAVDQVRARRAGNSPNPIGQDQFRKGRAFAFQSKGFGQAPWTLEARYRASSVSYQIRHTYSMTRDDNAGTCLCLLCETAQIRFRSAETDAFFRRKLCGSWHVCHRAFEIRMRPFFTSCSSVRSHSARRWPAQRSTRNLTWRAELRRESRPRSSPGLAHEQRRGQGRQSVFEAVVLDGDIG